MEHSEQAEALAPVQPHNFATVMTRTLVGVRAAEVIVEVHLANGLPCFNLVGLAETAIKESKERVRAALVNSGFDFPARRITVNLSPADLPKSGSQFDLPIALGILLASQQIILASQKPFECFAELSLDGQLRRISGAMPCVWAATKAARAVFLPKDNMAEAQLLADNHVFAADSLLSVCRHLINEDGLCPVVRYSELRPKSVVADISDVMGQHHAKRALEIAAAGKHNMLMVGPPGAGKSMLAQRLPGLLPLLELEDALESAAIQSVANVNFDASDWRVRPFRSPHHSSSAVALIGGGSHPKPGEVSKSHQGVLFLDEVTEFSRVALEQLREPLETGYVDIARAHQTVRFPASFQLLAACNPCRCGYFGDGSNRCQCSAASLVGYQSKLSGPLMDRIDLYITLSAVDLAELDRSKDDRPNSGECSMQVRQRVELAHARQLTRQGCLNGVLSNQAVDEHLNIQAADAEFLLSASRKLKLSARGFYRVKKLALTIADLESAEGASRAHLSEALSFRIP